MLRKERVSFLEICRSLNDDVNNTSENTVDTIKNMDIKINKTNYNKSQIIMLKHKNEEEK
jgi:hypothetical protein